MPTFATLWDQLLCDRPDAQTKRMAWKVLRQFIDDEQIHGLSQQHPNWHWNVLNPPTTEKSAAIKLLLENRNGVRCETVVILPPGPAAGLGNQSNNGRTAGKPKRATACISSQPGCGVGCPFCATASLGYRGDLSASEILEQVLLAGRTARQLGRQLRNVVYMGMGEPLHNAAAVFESLHWLTAENGFGLSPRRITVSTAGVPAAMVALAKRYPHVRMALSLHAAERDLRRQLVPHAVSDLEQLRETIREVNFQQSRDSDRNRPVWIEVVLLDQCNDSIEHAQLLIEFCRGLCVEINLIPYNTTIPISGGVLPRFAASPQPRREAFARVLRQAGIRTTLRTSFGSSNRAACGQLTAGVAQPLRG